MFESAKDELTPDAITAASAQLVVPNPRYAAVRAPLVALASPERNPWARFLFMKNRILSIAAGLCVVAARFVQADEIEYQKIRAAMSKLAPLVGEWNAVWTFHDKDGAKEEPGTQSISLVLDGTYLEFQWEHHNKQDPTRVRKVTSFVTFNPRSNQYDSTYFYRWNALRVTDTGEYDPVLQEFRTRGFIPLEDGVNDETVRTITSLKDVNRILYKHYSRRSPAETCERMDLEIVFTRVRR